MGDFIGNIKELRDIDLTKVLIASTTIMLVSLLASKLYPVNYEEFLQAVGKYSTALKYKDWAGIVTFAQRILDTIVVVGVFALFVSVCVTIYQHNKNADGIKNTIEVKTSFSVKVTTTISKISYISTATLFNVNGYCKLLGAPTYTSVIGEFSITIFIIIMSMIISLYFVS